jgi:geranylgeranyl reductase family protein
MAALRLAEAGRRVLVIDWRQDIGDKLCTGIIGKECAEMYPPNESRIFQKASSATVVSPAGVRYDVSRNEPQAYIVDRASYVRSFAESAMQAGAEYRLGPRVSNIEVSDNNVRVTTTDNSGTETLKSQVLIVASGFGSPLLRMAGFRDSKKQEFMIGCQAVVKVEGLHHTEVYLGEKIVPGSFGWVVPLSDSRALAGLLSLQKSAGDMNCLIEAIRGDGRTVEFLGVTQKWGIPLKPASQTYGDRVLAVGDSAGLVKPTTGGGIYYALRSGEMAADAINAAFEKGDFSARQLKGYEQAWKSVFGREMRIGYYARAMYEALDDRQIENLMSEFFSERVQNEIVNSSDFSFDWHSRAILKAINYRSISTVIGSFGPIVSSLVRRLR